MKNPIIIAALSAAISVSPALTPSASAAGLKFAPGTSERTKAKLNRWFQRHIYSGGRLIRRDRAALGDPNMAVFDRRRFLSDDTYQCTFITRSGKRAVVCD